MPPAAISFQQNYVLLLHVYLELYYIMYIT